MKLMKSYAVSEQNSLGRIHDEPKSPLRNDFQRDRDRIIHSSAFRRLMYKTQVFVNHEGDMFRTRLTHSLEVAQISRGITRSLGLNEDLAETIALAHDLGHTPFGHAGQDALNQCMQDFGGFEHNLQSLRVVDVLEKRYFKFNGLNLTFESREGILKHCSIKNARELAALGERFIKKTQPSLEAQVVDVADGIAYNIHDLEDGYRSGILTVEMMCEVGLFEQIFSEMNKIERSASEKIRVYETLRRMMHLLIDAVTKQSQRNISSLNISQIDEVRQASQPLIRFGKDLEIELTQCRQSLKKMLYQHERIQQMSIQAHEMIKVLFNYYRNNIDLVPKDYQIDHHPERAVADFVSGMTDRFAINLYESLKK
ncbi:MAG: deoxyguanosinetriphosphate triphosphohydrolase [Methylophilaceae bacterium]